MNFFRILLLRSIFLAIEFISVDKIVQFPSKTWNAPNLKFIENKCDSCKCVKKMQLNFIGCVLWFVYLWKSLCNLFDARVLTVCYVFVFMEIEYLVFESLVFIQINAVSVLFHFVFVFFLKNCSSFLFYNSALDVHLSTQTKKFVIVNNCQRWEKKLSLWLFDVATLLQLFFFFVQVFSTALLNLRTKITKKLIFFTKIKFDSGGWWKFVVIFFLYLFLCYVVVFSLKKE